MVHGLVSYLTSISPLQWNCQAIAEVGSARQQLLALEAELDAARTRLAAEEQAAESSRGRLSRERAVAEEQRHGVVEQLRQLQFREEALQQVGRVRGSVWVG